MGELDKYLVPYSTGNPCQDCAYPIADCPWLHEEKPVPGWTAKLKTRPSGRYSNGKKKWVTTYSIESCPLYIQMPERESSPETLTEEQDKVFTRGWGRKRDG